MGKLSLMNPYKGFTTQGTCAMERREVTAAGVRWRVSFNR